MSDNLPQRLTFSKQLRLLRSAEFDATFSLRISASDGRLLVYGRPNELGFPRLGLVVSRKVGKAVVRNRWKRVLREAFRLSQHELPAMDLVCLPRSRENPTLDKLQDSLQQLAQRVAQKAKRRGVMPDRKS